MTMAKLNTSVKALKATMACYKNFSDEALLEYEMAFQTNNKRGKVYNQSELNELYSRNSMNCGASKACHTRSHEGEPFEYIVVKRHRVRHDGGDFVRRAGNQLISEIECWQELAETPAGDLLCPVLKFFTSKSDKVGKTSDTMLRNVVMICQKAVFVGDAMDACRMAEQMNKERNKHGENASDRYTKLKALSDERGWWDAMHNCGNSGVIYDYAKGCYKAVFIDYAL